MEWWPFPKDWVYHPSNLTMAHAWVTDRQGCRPVLQRRDRVGQKSAKPKKTKQKNTRKPRKPRRPTGPECLRHRVVFFCFCLQFCMPQGKDAGSWVLSLVCSFACPKGRMQRVESCHLFAVLHAPREGCRELSLVICLFSCQSMHMSKQRMCKEECKKRTLVIPCSEKKCRTQSDSRSLYTSDQHCLHTWSP